MRGEARKRVLLIGVDGAEPSIIYRLAREGTLENIQRLMQGGTWCRLRSTIPAHTVPAWTSSVTGVNPGKHGLYDFALSVDPRSRSIEYANSRRRKVDAFWNILSHSGKKVIILNVPVTYPPEKVNGVMVSGMLTPTTRSSFVYPSSLKDELINLRYQIDLAGTAFDLLLKRVGGEINMLSSIQDLIRERAKAAKYLMKEYEWRLFMVVFVGLDRLQHFYWNFIDPNHITYQKKEAQRISKEINSIYRELDRAIGELVNLSRGADVLVYSDHGFRPVNGFFFTNNFLKGKQMLRTKSQHMTKISFGREEIIRTTKNLRLDSLASHLPSYLKRRIGAMIHPSSSFSDIYELDMDRTIAYQFSEFIRMNDEIMDLPAQQKAITEIVNGINGLKIGIRAFPKEAIYKGPEMRRIPPLVLVPEHDCNPSQFLPLNGRITMEYNPELKIPSLLRCGDHSRWGIYIMAGPSIRSGFLMKEADIIDIAPTILRLCEEKVPPNIDGHVSESVKKSWHLN